MIRNLIFDWSGTISDDQRIVYAGSMQVFSHFGLAAISYEEFRREFTVPFMGFYEKYSSNIDQHTAREIFLRVLPGLGEPLPFAGAVEVVRRCAEQAPNVVVFSGVPQVKLLKEVEDFGLTPVFREVLGGIYDKRADIGALMERNGFLASETAYIGDMRHDIEAGKLAGVTTIALSWGYEQRELLARSEPDYLLSSVHQVPEILRVL